MYEYALSHVLVKAHVQYLPAMAGCMENTYGKRGRVWTVNDPRQLRRQQCAKVRHLCGFESHGAEQSEIVVLQHVVCMRCEVLFGAALTTEL